MNSIGINREEIALRILCAFISMNRMHPSTIIHDDIRSAFKAADRFIEVIYEDEDDE